VVVLPELVECPRLTLRCWRVTDVALIGQAITASLDHLRPWMAWAADEPLSDDARLALIEQWEQERCAGGGAVYGTFLADVVVGGTGFHRRAGPETLEIGYWVHAGHLRRGYATELARQLTTTAFTLPGITRVEIHHDRANIASGGVPARLGYRREGERPDAVVAPSEVGVDVTWSMAKLDWAVTTRSG
jgi:ribosomal-protein-serine acetyltransferase